MSGVRVKKFKQPESFAFSKESMKLVDEAIAKYPKGRQASAVMTLLHIAQKQHGGWIPEKAMEEIGRILDMPRVKVFEVATFYTMYKLHPVGEHHIDVCTTTPCWLRGSANVVKACEDHLGIKLGETTEDGKFSLEEVECLGACVNAPVMQRNGEDLYEDLDARSTVEVLQDLAAGRESKHGSRVERYNSTGEQGATVLKEQAEKAGIKYVEG